MRKPNQYKLGKDNLYFFYRHVILPWEINHKNSKYLLKQGSLDSFCHKNRFSIKSFESTNKLKDALMNEFENEMRTHDAVFWFVRKDTKPKDTLRHLRNSFAHGHFNQRQKNKSKCVFFENKSKNDIKAKGFIPIDILSSFIKAIDTCRIKE